jgi:Rrf2 family transcriptional regulator, nitric oxide-sensitive transcriptional repressor
MYVAVNHGPSTIGGCAATYGIPKKHLEKVAPKLVANGFLTSIIGRRGGLRLARPPEEISIGSIVRITENDFEMAECFSSSNACLITAPCRLRNVLSEALSEYLAVLDRHSLASLIISNTELRALLSA